MATPSSSATSASPPMAYLQPNGIMATTSTISMDPLEKEQRKKAVQKFLARAEVSMVTRGLRARLSYASYKATHNISHIPLRDLEAQSQSQAASFSRSSSSKRRAGGNNYYNNPATQGNGGVDVSTTGSGTNRGAMAPPSVSMATSRSHYPNVNGSTRTANATQSLYSSILALPPTKFARTIHNASDPPQTASSRTGATPRTRRGSKLSEPRRSIAESTRAQAKSRKEDKRKDKRSSKGTQKERTSTPSIRLGEDVDMKAAATLTSLLLQKRPSMTENASSPRSSISAPLEPGPSRSYSHFAQSSTRTTTAMTTAVNSAEPSFILPNHRSVTPPPHHFGASLRGDVTPKAAGAQRPDAPTDSEAADLMLYLATSPSPARPTTSRDKDAKDVAAFRALGGGEGLRATGRVLFPSAGTGNDSGGTLTNLSDNSFAISMSSIGSEIPDGEPGMTAGKVNDQVPKDGPAVSSHTQLARMATQLLPPPPSPSVSHLNSDSSSQTLSANSWPMYSSDHKSALQAPPTPNNLSFNFNDFINVSPSPTAPLRNANMTSQSKPGLSSSLKADIGRKLFEEEQHRHQAQTTSYGDFGLPVMGSAKMQGFDDEFGDETSRRGGSLGAGIDLVLT